MVIHELLAVAAHAHPAEVVTVMLPELPFTAIDAFVGDTEYPQDVDHMNALERALRAAPPGPTAAMTDS